MPAEGRAEVRESAPSTGLHAGRPPAPPGLRSFAPELPGFAAALALPFLAYAVQSAVWPQVQPFAWFLFYPAVFAASWVGGLRGGLAATVVATTLAWYGYIPPYGTLAKDEPRYLISAVVFAFMGVLFAVVHGRLRASERATRRANEDLSERERELVALNDRLAELDRLKSQLFANVSHELRTPLALILAPAEQLLAQKDLAAAGRATLETIVRNARLLRGHVDDLLDLATMEAKRLRLSRSSTDLAALVGRVAGTFETVAAERNLTLRVDVGGPLECEVDAEKVQRVLLNLLSNALKFTPEGGVVRVSLHEEDDRAVLEVADSGRGIAAEHREVVFERFRQLEGGDTRRFGGTGLGLWIARELVTLHGGTITVGDAAEGGASFVVTLPRRAPPGSPVELVGAEPPVATFEVPRRAVPTAARAPAGEGPLVLVVEDNPDLNAFLCGVLGEDYRVLSAFDGAEGIRMAIEHRPDLVLTDLMMPETSGDVLVRTLHARPEMAETPIVVLTARADEALREELLRCGAQDWVGKPFVTGELLARVGNLVAARTARAALRRREEQLRAIFDGASVGIVHIRPDGSFVGFNERFREILAYPREVLRGKRFPDVTHPEDRDADWEGFTRTVREGGDRYIVEKRYVRFGGEPVWVRVDAGIVRDEHGGVVGAVAVVEDIDERKRAEAEVRRLTRVRERVAAEAAGVGVWDLDLRSGVIAWSDTAFRMLGHEPSPDGQGTWETWFGCVDPADLPGVLEAMDRARVEHSLFTRGHRIVGVDRTRWVRPFGRYLYDEATGEPVRFVGMVFDETERHEAEAARHEAEERLGLLVQAVSEYALIALDAAGCVVSWNEGAERIYGYRAAEAIGLCRAALFPPDVAAWDLPSAAAAGSSEVEGWASRKDGSRFWASVVVSARRQERGVVAGFLTVTRDLTLRREAEEAVRAANARLEDRIADLEAFSYVVSHDLRAPLRAIQGYARFVEEDLGDAAGPESGRMLVKMREAALRMDHLIRDVLNYSQISRAAPVTGPVDLDAVVAHVVAHYPDVSCADVKVRAPLGTVIGQESLLVQIVANLLGNAVKFVPKDRAPRVEVWSERRPGGRLHVVVRDNGIGIAREHWDRIFLPFERLQHAEAWPGTGIGLAIARKAVERLGGVIGVESEPGEGSRFWFELPEVVHAP